MRMLDVMPTPQQRPQLSKQLRRHANTHFFKKYLTTDRYVDFDEAVNDVFMMFKDKKRFDLAAVILKIYRELREDQIKCIISMWTISIEFTTIMNCALVVDAVNTYPNLDRDDFEFYFESLEKRNLDYKTIIDNTVKFMRLLNTIIVDKATPYNDEDRVTYRGVSKTILPGIEVGEIFRIANWLATSENKAVGEKFTERYDDDDQLIIELHIKEG